MGFATSAFIEELFHEVIGELAGSLHAAEEPLFSVGRRVAQLLVGDVVLQLVEEMGCHRGDLNLANRPADGRVVGSIGSEHERVGGLVAARSTDRSRPGIRPSRQREDPPNQR